MKYFIRTCFSIYFIICLHVAFVQQVLFIVLGKILLCKLFGNNVPISFCSEIAFGDILCIV